MCSPEVRLDQTDRSVRFVRPKMRSRITNARCTSSSSSSSSCTVIRLSSLIEDRNGAAAAAATIIYWNDLPSFLPSFPAAAAAPISLSDRSRLRRFCLLPPAAACFAFTFPAKLITYSVDCGIAFSKCTVRKTWLSETVIN